MVGLFGGLLAAAVEPASAPARFIPPLERAYDFRLPDQDGKPATLRQQRGKVVILTFLYSTCRDLCPAQAAIIVDAVMRVGGKGVFVYGVSVDPVGDTPARTRAFLEQRHLYGGPVRFLRGTRGELEPVWRSYGIVPIHASPQDAAAAAVEYDRLRGLAPAGNSQPPAYRHPERTAPPAADEPYPDTGDLEFRGRARHRTGLDFEHSAYVMLIDKHGRQRVGIPFEQLTAKGLAADIRALQREP